MSATSQQASLDQDPRVVLRRARRGPRRRLRLVLATLSVLLVAAFAANVLLGDYTYTIVDFFRILFGADIPVASYLLMESKLPRALLAILVGLCFGASGAIFQITLRNPLASPDLLGVTMGASVAAVWGVLILGLKGSSVSGLAIVGALATAAVIRLAGGRAGGQRIVLVGVTLTGALASVVHYLMSRASLYDVQVALQWLAGSLQAADWGRVRLLAACLVITIPILVALLPSLRATQLGDELATGLGVGRHVPDLLLAVAVVLIAVAVGVAGPIAFLAFMSGPIARALNAGRHTILGAALVGAVLMLLADYIGQYLIGDVNVPVGLITGATGAPFLLWLLSRGAVGKGTA
ncbi:FecCD family ABC transporter permease [Nocardioides sp. GXZ039]|uniref:FecCD family ABC transporter permease n=1 Tax=Nocardioides sp. GXZ039 TaxID=3136018 RepID=UPI0030F3A108